MTIRIVSLGYAAPTNFVMTQEEVYTRLGYKTALVKRIFSNAKIRKRHFYCDPLGLPVEELRAQYEKGVVELGCRAIENALDGRSLSDIGCLIFVSTTSPRPFTPGPAHLIAAELGVSPNMVLLNELGGGCQGSLPGLLTAYTYAKAFKRPAIAVSVELCSTTYYPAPETDLEQSVCAAIFGDAAASVLVAPSEDPNYPAIIGFHSTFDRRNLYLTGYAWTNGRLKVILSRELPRLVPPLMAQTIRELLTKHGLTVEDVGGWAIHNGGVSVLENLAKELGLDGKQAFRYSWEVLGSYGNCSSATVGIVAKTLHADPANRQGYIVGAAMGAGAEVSAVVARYGG